MTIGVLCNNCGGFVPLGSWLSATIREMAGEIELEGEHCGEPCFDVSVLVSGKVKGANE